MVSERSLADLRKSVYQKIIWLPLSFFDNRRVGELMSRITSDVSTLSDMFSFTLAELLRQFLTLILGTVVIFFLAPKLTGFMLLTFPVLVILALVFGKYIRKLSRKTQDKLAEANVVVEESLQSISVVKAFTNEVFEITRVRHGAERCGAGGHPYCTLPRAVHFLRHPGTVRRHSSRRGGMDALLGSSRTILTVGELFSL